MNIPSRWLGAVLLALNCVRPLDASAASPGKPVLLYSRHFNAIGETRYLPDGSFRDILAKLRTEFDVRVHAESITGKTLESVQVLLIANPSEKAVGTNPPPHHPTPADIQTLVGFVERGGGLIITGNQEDHNLELERFNALLSEFGLRVTNVYTDAKRLVVPASNPLLGGLRWAYYTGNQVGVVTPAPRQALPRSLIDNDLAQKPVKGPRDQAGSLLAVSERGRGRVIYVTDTGWLADVALSGAGIGGVSIKDHDNWEIFRRLTRWAAHSP